MSRMIIVKLIGRDGTVAINGDAITYAEGGNVLEILDENEEILAVYRNWEYAMVQESEEEYQRSLQANLDDEEDEEDFDEGLDEDDEGLDGGDEELSPAEEEAVQRAREVMQRAIAEHNDNPPVLTLEQFDENSARSEPQS